LAEFLNPSIWQHCGDCVCYSDNSSYLQLNSPQFLITAHFRGEACEGVYIGLAIVAEILSYILPTVFVVYRNTLQNFHRNQRTFDVAHGQNVCSDFPVDVCCL